MTKYREILRLASLGISQQGIAVSCNASKKTVNRVLQRAREMGLTWPLDPNLMDEDIAKRLFPPTNAVNNTGRRSRLSGVVRATCPGWQNHRP